MAPKRAASAASSEASSKKPKVACSTCGKTYTSMNSLNYHIKTMHEGRRFSCQYDCGKSYTSKSAVNEHVQIKHEGIRFSCPHDDCDKTYGEKDTLDRHVKAKHEGNGFPCPYDDCDEIFSWSTGLNEHINYVHKGIRHHCTVEGCTASFGRASILHEHVSSVHEEPQFPCPFDDCDKIYTARNTLVNHIKSKHGTPEDAAELFQKRLELRQFLAEKEVQGLCSATKSYELLAAKGSFHCSHHLKAQDPIAKALEEKRAKGRLSDLSIKHPDEFNLLLQRSQVDLDTKAKISLHLLAQGFNKLSSKIFAIDAEFIQVGQRLIPLDITVMRPNSEELISTRVDYDMDIEDLQAQCTQFVSRRCVRKVYGQSDRTWGKTPSQIVDILQKARFFSLDATI